MSQFSSLSRRGNYAYAGKVAANDALKAFIQQKRNSPDMGQLVLDAEKIKAKERLNAIKRTKETFNTIANIEADSKINKIKTEADLNLTQSKRFAGVLGAAGQLVSGGANKLYDANQPKPERDTSLVDFLNQERETLSKELEKAQSKIDSSSTLPEIPVKNNTTDSNKTTPLPNSQNLSSPNFEASGPMSKAQIKQLAINSGFSPSEASTVVGIAGGESGFDPTNSTKRSGLYGKTGEDSVGLMQINWGYHKDKGWLQKLGITKREDLFDPVKNMKAAKYLYDGRGNFGDWTVYNEGLYQQHL
jgi:hypothetical protein